MSVQSAAKYVKESRGWAYNVLKIYEETGNVDFSHERGPKRVTTEQEDLEMVKLATADKPKTTEQIADILTAKGMTVSRYTVGRRLKEHNVRWKSLLKKPLLSQVQIERRLLWANDNLDRDWTRVIFTDESSFELNCQVTRAWQIRGKPKIYHTVKHPTKVNVWGCFSSRGFGKLVIISGILESKQMVEIYEKGLLPSAKKFYGEKNRNWHLLEDGDPKHTSKVSKAWKANKKVKVLDWPANSPDCNPIENVWAFLKAKIRQRNITCKDGLIRAIKEEWTSLSIEYAQTLASSGTRRCKAVIENNGDWIPY
jgi:transposase